MAKKQHARHDEVMLIPFLDILCSLIGVLILIIVVVCASSMQKSQGRTREELMRAARYQELVLEKKKLEASAPEWQTKLAALERLASDLSAKERRAEELRKQLAAAANDRNTNRDAAAKLQKELDDLKRQIAAVTASLAPLQAEIDKLNKLLAERRKEAEIKPPTVVVRATGSGTRGGRRLAFVEAGGAGIVIHKTTTSLVRVPSSSLGVDKDYNDFLKTVKEAGNTVLVFLIRKDGWWTYIRAAGWAEQEFGLTTSKLPIPSDGPVDTSLLEGK